MNIRHATGQDMDALCALYAEGRRFMAAHGNTAQWRGGYPGALCWRKICAAGSCMCANRAAPCAAFVFFVGEEPSYAHIDGAWLCGGPYGVVHRLCSPGAQRARPRPACSFACSAAKACA